MLREISILDIATFMVLYHLFCQYEADKNPEKFRYYNNLNMTMKVLCAIGIVVNLMLR
jgi:hypothetical protein